MNKPLIKLHCEDKNLYENEILKNYIDFVFEQPEVVSRSITERVGKAHSTCDLSPEIVLTMPGIQNLLQWIIDQLEENSHHFISKEVSGVEFTRAWMNKMFKDSSGIRHVHRPIPDGVVCIFYIQVPENSSKLLVHYDDGDEEIEVKVGDLIIHDNQLPHSVTSHGNDIPRMCFIFECYYV